MLPPDFVVADFSNGTNQNFRMATWLAARRPILMVFYSPTSRTATELLRFAQALQETYHEQGVLVLGMAVSEDGELVRRQRDNLRLNFPTLCGAGLRQSYALEATPKLLLIDRGGIVRGAYVGWGSETPGMVQEELRHWLPVETPGAREPLKK